MKTEAYLERICYDGFAVLEVRPFTPVEVGEQARVFLDTVG